MKIEEFEDVTFVGEKDLLDVLEEGIREEERILSEMEEGLNFMNEDYLDVYEEEFSEDEYPEEESFIVE